MHNPYSEFSGIANALHTVARRFCQSQHMIWTTRYADLQRTEGYKVENLFKSGWSYSDNALGMFPRYRIANDILIEIEKLSFELGTPRVEAEKLLFDAGNAAFEVLAVEFNEKPIALAALSDELHLYLDHLRGMSLDSLTNVEPLPYRRVLAKIESELLWKVIQAKWGIRGQGFGWYPISDDPRPTDVLTFHEEMWSSRNGTDLLLKFLKSKNIERCFVLRELGPPHYEIETSLIDPVYRGSEEFLTADGDWILYTSHESSYTLAGSLAAFVRATWPDADAQEYGGPFHTDDLRGTWKW